MKFLCALLLIFIQPIHAEDDTKDMTSTLFEIGGKPTPLLKELLEIDGLYEADDNYQTIRAKTQQKWIRCIRGKGGVERRDLVDSPQEEAIKDNVTAVMDKMGLFDEACPLYKEYDYALILGAFLPSVEKRIDQLICLQERGVRFKEILFLTGERPLREDEKISLNSADLQTETDMVRALVAKHRIKASIVDAKALNGLRPSTEDTYRAWIEEFHPKEGTVLAISSPLFVYLQHLIGKRVLPKGFALDTISGPVTQEELNSPYYKTSVLLDTMAKMIYAIEER